MTPNHEGPREDNPALANADAETPGIQAASYLIQSGAPLLPQLAIDAAITHTSLVGERGGYDHMVEFISVVSTIENGDLAIDLLDGSNPARLKMIFVRGRKSYDVVSAPTAHLTPLWQWRNEVLAKYLVMMRNGGPGRTKMGTEAL